MKVAGIGFRASATLNDLRQALALLPARPDALASLHTKTATDALKNLAQETGLPLLSLSEDDIAGEQTLTCSPRIKARFATGSLAEAAALVGARHGQTGARARLIAPRVITADGLATAALAERFAP